MLLAIPRGTVDKTLLCDEKGGDGLAARAGSPRSERVVSARLRGNLEDCHAQEDSTCPGCSGRKRVFAFFRYLPGKKKMQAPKFRKVQLWRSSLQMPPLPMNSQQICPPPIPQASSPKAADSGLRSIEFRIAPKRITHVRYWAFCTLRTLTNQRRSNRLERLKSGENLGK